MRVVANEHLKCPLADALVTAMLVEDPALCQQYWRRLAKNCSVVPEDAIFDALRAISPDYDGGAWRTFALSNGGLYMAPATSRRYQLSYDALFTYEVSADTAGIIASASALSQLALLEDSAAFGTAYKLLAAFIFQHRDVRIIRAALH